MPHAPLAASLALALSLPAVADSARYVLYLGCQRAGEATLSQQRGHFSWRASLGPVESRAEAWLSPRGALIRAEGERRGAAGARSSRAVPGEVTRLGPEGAAREPLAADVLPALAFESWVTSAGGGCRAVVEEETGLVGQACATVQPAPSGGVRLTGRKLGVEFTAEVDAAGVPIRYELPALQALYAREGSPPPTCSSPTPRAAAPVLRRPASPRLPRNDRMEFEELARAAAQDGAPCLTAAARFARAARAAGRRARIRVGQVETEGAASLHAWNEVLLRGAWVAIDPALDEIPAVSRRAALGPPLDSPGAELAAALTLGLGDPPVPRP